MSKLTFLITTLEYKDEYNVYDNIKTNVEGFFSKTPNQETASGMNFTWYNDQPVSTGVALTIEFHDLTSFNLLSKLQIYLNKYGYLIYISLGY